MESSSDGHGVQLQPETILYVAMETEEKLWNQVGITDGVEESLHTDDGELGNLILQHGKLMKRVHNYFTNLEQRKCCLLLAGCKQTFRSVRLVRSDGRDSGIEEGAMMKSAKGNSETATCLSAEDFQVFQHALRCAAFPVLGAPDPPSGSSPSPRATPAIGLVQKRFVWAKIKGSPVMWPLELKQRRGNVLDIIVKSDNALPDLSDSMVLARTMTPISAGDSGVEESDDAMVPAETLCEQLRRAFQLSPEKFTQYEHIVASQLEKKSPQKILVEELVRQLMALENNANTFYNPTTFLNRLGYDRWQQKERMHITELIQKFWHFSLPQPTPASTRSSQPKHEQYVRLMEKLIHYEFPYRQENENDVNSAPPTCPLSSASLRLLKEFGLRYGVGEQYRKIVYLHYLATNFEPTLWFIQHMITSLTCVMECMPSKRSFLTIVKEEHSLLEQSLHLLDVKTSAAVEKMKTLFPANQPVDGIESLIDLLSITLQSKSYLLMQTEERLALKLQKIIQGIFPTTYERHKLVAKDELRQNKWEVELNPRLLNMLIGHIRDEVNDYKVNYQHTFSRYFNITLEAAQEFYKLLMSDLEELHTQSQDDMNNMEIDLLMLSLAYRLNQLDKDWSSYITPQMQTWRDILLQEAQHWSIVMKVHMQEFVTQAVGQDTYDNAELKWIGSLHQSSTSQSTPGRGQRRHSNSMMSLTPSINSAFSTLSSPHSTPGPKQTAALVVHPPVIQESGEDHTGPKQTTKDRPSFTPLDNTRLVLNEKFQWKDRRPYSDPVNISHSSVLNGSYIGDMARSLGHYEHDHFLSFAHIRHSSSLPNLQYIEIMKQEKSNTLKSETGESADTVKVDKTVLNVQKQDIRCDTINVPSSDDTSSKAHGLVGGEESQEVQNFMESRVSMTTELEESDDSHTLTDDSASEDREFTFPPLEEVDSVPASPVPMLRHEPVTLSETLNKMSVLRPNAKSLKQDAPTSKNMDVLKKMKQSEIKTNDRGKTAINNNQSKWSETNNSISASNVAGDDMDVKHSSGSGVSNVSFPCPQKHFMAFLPLSSSAIDMFVILQRLVWTGKILCQTFSPIGRAFGSNPSNPTTSSSEEELHFHPQSYKCRQKLYDGFLNCLCSTVCVYADNMLCMDLCGTSSSTASKLAGPRLVEYLQTQQRSGLIWGCRHNLAGNSCFEYMDKKTNLLCDRHEPVTRDMCTRINNIMAMLTFLDAYHRRLGNMFGVYGDWSLKQKKELNMSINSMETLRSDFIVVDNYGYDPSGDRMDVVETVSQIFSRTGVSPAGQPQIVVSSTIDSYKNHLMAVLRAQSRLIAYRLNLFVCDALPVLLTLKSPTVTLDRALKPVTDFLTSYINVLRQWLYMDSFRRVLECLWIFIVQDFELELYKLERQEDSTEAMGKLLLQAIAHLLKYMNSQDESLRKELLLEQADDVSFRLNLYAMPVSHLISIYKGLVKESHDIENTSMDTHYQSAIQIRDRLKHDLQKFRKGFSGHDLVKWILDNQELFMCFLPEISEGDVKFTQETAFHAAQRLLDWGLIADVEGGSIRSHSPTMSVSFEFPDLTQVPGGYERPFSRQSNDSTPQATPRATPRPNLRDSIRASSRLSLLKNPTSGLRNVDKSASVSSSRFLCQSKVDKNDRFDKSKRTSQMKQNSESSKDVSTDGSNIVHSSRDTSCKEQNLESGEVVSIDDSIIAQPNDVNVNKTTAAENERLVVEIHGETDKAVTEIPVTIRGAADVDSGLIGNSDKITAGFAKSRQEQNTGGSGKIEDAVMNSVDVGDNAKEKEFEKGKYTESSESHAVDSFESGFVQDSTEIAENQSLRTDSLCNFVRLVPESSAVNEPDVNYRVIGHNQEISGPKQEPSSYQESNEFDPYLGSGTPLSFTSGLSSSSHSIMFDGTGNHFYYVCPQVCGEMETTLKNYEQFELVEECYQKKILPEYILRIIYSRRKKDESAKNFVGDLPYSIIQTLTLDDEDSVSMCVSS